MKMYISTIFLFAYIAAGSLAAWNLGSGLTRQMHNAARQSSAPRPSLGEDKGRLPRVLRELSTQDSFIRERYIALGEALPECLGRFLPQILPAAEVRANAAGLVGQFGAAAKPALPQLIKLLRDDLADANAASSLALLGPTASEAVPALIVALQEERPFAATALGSIGDAAARPALQAATLTGPPWLRREAANALRKIDAISLISS